jgi:hypothetical protein
MYFHYTLQRYYLNRLYYRPGGPVFFLFSGEGELNSGFLQTCMFLIELNILNYFLFTFFTNAFFASIFFQHSDGGTVMDDMMTNAKRHNAMVLSMEHRYYGQSVPIV